MTSVKDLYIGDSIPSLSVVASKNFDEIRRNKKLDTLCRLGDKLYKMIFVDPLDEEKMYIFLLRFNFVYDHMLNVITDKNFVKLRFGTEAARVKYQLAKVEDSLSKRYKEKKETKVTFKDEEEKSPKTPQLYARQKIFNAPESFITCQELMQATNLRKRVLLLDIRRREEFEESRIKNVDCINIPEEIIVSGTTAHKIGKAVPSNCEEIWKLRDTYAIVLMDWSSTAFTCANSKVSELRCVLLEWDFEMDYYEEPVILNGGYLEFLEFYPSMCTNPNVIHNRSNVELDELLQLEEIEYPQSLNPSMAGLLSSASETVLDFVPAAVEQDDSRESIVLEEKEVAKKKRKIELDIIDAEKEWRHFHQLSENEKSIVYQKALKELQDTISRLIKDRNRLDHKRTELDKKFSLFASFKPGEENINAVMQDIEALEKESEENSCVLDAMATERERILDLARSVKPKRGEGKTSPSPTSSLSDHSPTPTPSISATNAGPAKPPKVDRFNKPSLTRAHMEGGYLGVSDGLSGLSNIKNTCYMNTIVQCFRNLPLMMHFFCSGVYSTYITRHPDVLMSETACLMRTLWSNTYSYVVPETFYRALCLTNGNYGLGNHEDCMEFFIFFLSQLIEDTCEVMDPTKMISPIQKAWFDQLGGKRSIFTDIFYHQVKIVRECTNCKTKNIKFEVDSTIMVAIPHAQAFSLQEAVDFYLQDVSYLKNLGCSKCKSPISGPRNTKVVSHTPKVLVIDLKRYIQEVDKDGQVNVRKNNAEVRFKVKDFKFGNKLYSLWGMALHSGSLNSGHYTAVCRNALNDEWYEFNDANVKKVSNVMGRNQREKARAFFYMLQ